MFFSSLEHPGSFSTQFGVKFGILLLPAALDDHTLLNEGVPIAFDGGYVRLKSAGSKRNSIMVNSPKEW